MCTHSEGGARPYATPNKTRDIAPSSADQGANLCQLLRAVILQLQHQGEASSQPWICVHQHLKLHGTQGFEPILRSNNFHEPANLCRINISKRTSQGPLKDTLNCIACSTGVAWLMHSHFGMSLGRKELAKSAGRWSHLRGRRPSCPRSQLRPPHVDSNPRSSGLGWQAFQSLVG